MQSPGSAVGEHSKLSVGELNEEIIATGILCGDEDGSDVQDQKNGAM
jgi:hypothetical protein